VGYPSHGRKGHVWRKVRLRVLDRDHWTCHYCGQPANTVDHLEPLSDRPDLAHHMGNLVAACRTCNTSKGRGTAPTPRHAPADTQATLNPSRNW
jgi:5-methylcytosine-specific restriction endonuclease McrA